MGHDEIVGKVTDAVAAVLERTPEEVLDATRDQMASWDSLKHMEIVFAVEDALGIQFAESELADLDAVRKIIASAERHLAA